MGRFSILHPLYMSFYSRELYRDVALNWGGRVFWYLLLLLALCWVPVMGVAKSAVSSFITYGSPKFVSQVPHISISDGKAKVDAEMPYTISDPETAKLLVIIDTTGQVTSLDGSEAPVLLTETRLTVKKSEHETRVYELSEFGEQDISQEGINRAMATFDKWFVFIVFPFALFGSYIYRILQALLFGLIGLMYNRSLGAGLEFAALVRIAVVALTPAIMLNTFYLATRSNVPMWGLICFFVSVAYLYFGVVANVRELPSDIQR